MFTGTKPILGKRGNPVFYRAIQKVNRFRMENEYKLIPDNLLLDQTKSDLSSCDSDSDSSCESGDPEK